MPHGHKSSAQQAGKQEGMCHAAMAPEVAVLDAEVKADDIQIWNNRTSHTKKQNLPSHDRMWGSPTECEGNERMGECWRHKAAFHAKNERQRPFSKPICRQVS